MVCDWSACSRTPLEPSQHRDSQVCPISALPQRCGHDFAPTYTSNAPWLLTWQGEVAGLVQLWQHLPHHPPIAMTAVLHARGRRAGDCFVDLSHRIHAASGLALDHPSFSRAVRRCAESDETSKGSGNDGGAGLADQQIPFAKIGRSATKVEIKP